MSAFTEWNGPPPVRGPSTKDVLALIDAYNNANTALVKHIASTASDDVHGFSTALKDAIAGLETALKELIGEKADADALEELASKVSGNAALGLVGESVCGKTSTARLLVQVESDRLVRCVNPVG